jgi:hypothetical protein
MDELAVAMNQEPAKTPRSGDSRARGRRMAICLLAALVLSVVMTYVRDKPGMTVVYRTAAERFLQGEQFYRPQDSMAFTYPPFFVLAYLPLVWLPEDPARMVWYFANFCLLGAIVQLTVRMVGPIVQAGGRGGKARAIVACVLVGILSARFLISPIEYQSHDLIVYFLLMLGILAWSRSAGVATGGWVGLAAACKATPLLFLPVFLWQGRFRAVIALVAVLVLATLLPDLLSPSPDAPLWGLSWHEKFVSKIHAGSAPHAQGAWESWNMMNQSLSGTLHRLCTPVEQATRVRWDVCLCPLDARQIAFLAIGLKLAVLGLLLAIAWPGRLARMHASERTFSTLGQGGAILCAMLLLSPMTSKQHFCVLLAPLSFCVVDFLYRRRDPIVGIVLGFVLFVGALAGKDVVGPAIHRELAAYGSLTWCTLLCLLACGHIVVCRARAARRHSTDAEATPATRWLAGHDAASAQHFAENPPEAVCVRRGGVTVGQSAGRPTSSSRQAAKEGHRAEAGSYGRHTVWASKG